MRTLRFRLTAVAVVCAALLAGLLVGAAARRGTWPVPAPAPPPASATTR